MPNISVQLRRGTDTEHSSFTGAEGEVTVDTTNDTLRVHDGTTVGGIRLAKLSESGTVTSVGSGTGLTGGPITTSGTLSVADNGVTFDKMQDINTAKVIGRTTAGSGDPEEVSILDEDAMTSNSAIALATQQSIKAYVDAQIAASTVSKYSTGWQTSLGGVTVANGATLTVTHNLGTTDVQVAVYVNTSASDSGVTEVSGQDNWSTSDFGASITNLTSNNITLQLGSSGYTTTDSSGVFSAASYASAHLKVVVIG
jgi:hypothetical protein